MGRTQRLPQEQTQKATNYQHKTMLSKPGLAIKIQEPKASHQEPTRKQKSAQSHKHHQKPKAAKLQIHQEATKVNRRSYQNLAIKIQQNPRKRPKATIKNQTNTKPHEPPKAKSHRSHRSQKPTETIISPKSHKPKPQTLNKPKATSHRSQKTLPCVNWRFKNDSAASSELI